MADYSKKPSDPREPLLFRLQVSTWGPDPYSPAGGGGPGRFTCPLPTGTSAAVNAYDLKPGPLSLKEQGGFGGWWDDWWGEIEKSWERTAADVKDWYERAGQVKLAFDMAFTRKYVADAIESETKMLASALPAALLLGLRHMAEVLVTSTAAGAVVGGVLTIEAGGEGAIPGGMLGFDLGMLYLEVTGLAEIATYIVDNLGEVTARIKAGVERAWNAGRYDKSKKQDDIKAAAQLMAGAVGVLFRLLLEAVVAVILAKGIGKTVEALGESQFGKGFAEWVQKHQKELTEKFKPKTRSKGGGADESAEGGGAKPPKKKTGTQEAAAGADPGKPKTVRTLTSEEANAPHVAAGNRPPYAKGTTARDIVTTEDSKFVRVHGEGNQARSWMMREEDIKGLSADQIKDKFALPEKPAYVSDVNVPAGTKIRVGTVGAQEGWGRGGATQYELQQRLPQSAFTNRRPLK
jgi:hypothetical protein